MKTLLCQANQNPIFNPFAGGGDGDDVADVDIILINY